MVQQGTLAGRSVVVVGANSPVGLHIIAGLHDIGARTVVICGEPRIEATPSNDQTTKWVYADLSSQTSIASAYVDAESIIGNELHAVINLIDLSPQDVAAENVSEEEWDSVLAFNLSATFWSCQQAARRMTGRINGAIVNLSSIAGVSVAHDYRSAHYHAAKGAIDGLTRALATEWGGKGIRVNSLALGAYEGDASLGERLSPREGSPRPDGRDHPVPLGRLGRIDEVLPVVLFLASDDSSYLTGETLVADGGRRIPIN